jgi:hydrocephalus-inducing protein
VSLPLPFCPPPAGQQFPMVVEPSQIVIPPHEYRYTCLYFAPTAIQQYSATFEASVQGGADPATRGFSCELRGEGTLPTLSVQVGGARCCQPPPAPCA